MGVRQCVMRLVDDDDRPSEDDDSASESEDCTDAFHVETSGDIVVVHIGEKRPAVSGEAKESNINVAVSVIDPVSPPNQSTLPATNSSMGDSSPNPLSSFGAENPLGGVSTSRRGSVTTARSSNINVGGACGSNASTIVCSPDQGADHSPTVPLLLGVKPLNTQHHIATSDEAPIRAAKKAAVSPPSKSSSCRGHDGLHPMAVVPSSMLISAMHEQQHTTNHDAMAGSRCLASSLGSHCTEGDEGVEGGAGSVRSRHSHVLFEVLAQQTSEGSCHSMSVGAGTGLPQLPQLYGRESHQTCGSLRSLQPNSVTTLGGADSIGASVPDPQLQPSIYDSWPSATGSNLRMTPMLFGSSSPLRLSTEEELQE